MMYLVMECHPAYAIVLDQAGRMIKVANMGYEAGQKVDHVIARRTQTVPLRFRLAPLMIAACLCAAILGGGTYGACFMTYGTVELRINPDVMMSVSYTDRVVGLEGLNEDGIRLIDQVSYKGKNSEEMTQLLVERAVEMGYLKDGGTVLVKAQGSTGWKDKRENAISSGLSHMLEGRMRVEIKIGAAEEVTTPETPASQAPASTAHHPTPSVHPVAAPVATESSRQEERNKKRDDDGYNDGDDDQDDRDDDRDDGDDDQDDRDDDRDDGDDDQDDRDDDRDNGDDDQDDRDDGRDDGDDDQDDRDDDRDDRDDDRADRDNGRDNDHEEDNDDD